MSTTDNVKAIIHHLNEITRLFSLEVIPELINGAESPVEPLAEAFWREIENSSNSERNFASLIAVQTGTDYLEKYYAQKISGKNEHEETQK